MEEINNNPPYKMGQITVFVDGQIKKAKQKSGLTWRGLIIRGLKSLIKNDQEKEIEQTKKIEKMANKIQEQAIRIYKLENKFFR